MVLIKLGSHIPSSARDETDVEKMKNKKRILMIKRKTTI
tara:strand:+ start:391 stop:507 length:117 start_codon:yes stop_codon:yes gene_type:complete